MDLSVFFDFPLNDRQKKILNWFEAFLLIMLLNIGTKLVASAITLATRGVYDMLSGSTYTNSQMRLNIAYGITFPLMMLAIIYIVKVRRSRFQWDQDLDTWTPVRKGFFIKHATAYCVYSVFVYIYYIAVGLDDIYNPQLFVPGMKVDLATMTEPWWVANFFAPQGALFRVFYFLFDGVGYHNNALVIVLSCVINIVVFIAALYFACYVLKVKPADKS